MNKVIMLLCALALSRAAYPITATKAYVDSATNDTLIAAKAYTDSVAGVTPTVVTNIAGRVTSNVVTKAYVESLGISGGGITTNDVNAIIASSNLCTVAAAQAMTNAVMEYADDTFLKSSPGGYGYINWEGDALNVAAPSGLIVSHINTMTGTWEDYRAGDEDLPSYISSMSVTNGGAKSYADATFLTMSDGGYSSIGWSSGRLVVSGGMDVTSLKLLGGEWGSLYTEDQSLPMYISSTSVTNLGAVAAAKAYADSVGATTLASATNSSKAYADATFLKTSGGTMNGSLIFDYSVIDGFIKIPVGSFNEFCTIESEAGGVVFSMPSSVPSGYYMFVHGIKNSFLYPDNSDIATSNMVERVIASKPAPSPLTGKTYDFANGMNFTKNLYTALTNVIQTLGGTVANPPTFN